MLPILFLFLSCLSSVLYAELDFDEQQIQERIQPVGQVRVEGTAVEEEKVAATPEVKKLTAKEIYENHCIICHRDGVAGAPKFRNADDWKPRQAQRTLEKLVETAINGLNAMPPKGTCGDCSSEDIIAVIQYMLPQP